MNVIVIVSTRRYFFKRQNINTWKRQYNTFETFYILGKIDNILANLYLLTLLGVHCYCKYLEEYLQWNILDFEYPNEYLRNQALLTGKYKPQNGLPVGIEIWEDKIFVTVPRWREGVTSVFYIFWWWWWRSNFVLIW